MKFIWEDGKGGVEKGVEAEKEGIEKEREGKGKALGVYRIPKPVASCIQRDKAVIFPFSTVCCCLFLSFSCLLVVGNEPRTPLNNC